MDNATTILNDDDSNATTILNDDDSNDIVSTPKAKISLILSKSSADGSKVKFTPAEEKVAKGIFLQLGILAEIMKEETLNPLQKAFITPEIIQGINEVIEEGESNFPKLAEKVYRKIEASKTDADGKDWPVVKRAGQAINGMFRRVSVESKVLSKEQAEAWWPNYAAKYQQRTVRR